MTRGADGTESDVTPDTKDWTWVLREPCPECGFDALTVEPVEVSTRIRADAKAWPGRLTDPSATTRPAPGVWSILEYGCHVRDVHRLFDQRVRLMLTQDDPRFPNWDQDATAVAADYASQSPDVVAGELLEAASTVANTYDTVSDDEWSRRGFRSNGSEFTVSSIALYHLHDIVHHAWDVDPPH